MNTFIAYAAPIISVVAALTALLGPSRKPDQTGVASLTPFGWAAVGFVLTGLAFTLYNFNAQQNALRRAQSELAAIRRTAQSDFGVGIELIRNILRFAALMPYTTSAVPGTANPSPYRFSHEIDLRSARTLEDLSRLKLDPKARLNAPYIPSAVPFSPSTRTAMNILMEQAASAIEKLENARQIYVARAADAEVIEAASQLVQDPFLNRLTELEKKWQARSAIEDSTNPETVNLYFLDDRTNPSPAKYLALLDRIDRLQAALHVLAKPK
jgi:hypothetical protein